MDDGAHSTASLPHAAQAECFEILRPETAITGPLPRSPADAYRLGCRPFRQEAVMEGLSLGGWGWVLLAVGLHLGVRLYIRYGLKEDRSEEDWRA